MRKAVSLFFLALYFIVNVNGQGKKFTDYPSITTLGTNDVLLTAWWNGSAWTTNKQITATNMTAQMLGLAGQINVVSNNTAVYGEIDLGSGTNFVFDPLRKFYRGTATANFFLTLGTNTVTDPAKDYDIYFACYDATGFVGLPYGALASADPRGNPGTNIVGTNIIHFFWTGGVWHWEEDTAKIAASQIAGLTTGSLIQKGNGSGGLSPITSADLSSGPTTLADGATITATCVAGKALQNFQVTLGGNRTLAISGASAGMQFLFNIYQDGTGSRTLALPASSIVLPGDGTTISLTTTTNALDVLAGWFDGTTYFWAQPNIKALQTSTLTYGATITLNLSTNSDKWLVLAGNTTISTTGVASNVLTSVRIDADGSDRTIILPSGWHFMSGAVTNTLFASKIAHLVVKSYGTVDTNILASWISE